MGGNPLGFTDGKDLFYNVWLYLCDIRPLKYSKCLFGRRSGPREWSVFCWEMFFFFYTRSASTNISVKSTNDIATTKRKEQFFALQTVFSGPNNIFFSWPQQFLNCEPLAKSWDVLRWKQADNHPWAENVGDSSKNVKKGSIRPPSTGDGSVSKGCVTHIACTVSLLTCTWLH